MYTKIVIATDGSDTAKVAAMRGAELGVRSGAAVTVLSVGPPAAAGGAAGGAPPPPPPPPPQLDFLAEDGDPASVIIDVAEELGADLVVVGNKGMHGPRRLSLANVPNKVAHHAPCAVLIVKTT